MRTRNAPSPPRPIRRRWRSHRCVMALAMFLVLGPLQASSALAVDDEATATIEAPTATDVPPAEATATELPLPTSTLEPATETAVPPTATDLPPQPTATDPAPEPTATDPAPEPTSTEQASPTATDTP